MRNAKTISGFILAMSLATAGCTKWKMECRDGEAYINGRQFSCAVCYEELGCVLEGSTWRCPAGVDLYCMFDDFERQYCCGDHCVTCTDDPGPGEVCAGYTGTDTECCRGGDPCGFAWNGTCDCDGACSWDEDECSVDFDGTMDVLVVVDDSSLMAARQGMLISSFPGFLQSLLAPTTADAPVSDLHLGVISADMGSGGFEVTATCADPVDGDGGELQHSAASGAPGCDVVYPTFLRYSSYVPDDAMIAEICTDFACIADLGESGCGFEQPLSSVEAFIARSGIGDVNAGFLREGSFLLILVLTNEDDCSVEDAAFFDPANPDLGDMNLRCFQHPEMLYTVDHFWLAIGLEAARHSGAFVAMLAGVPGSPMCEGGGDEITDCLAVPQMLETVVDDGMGHLTLGPSCTSAEGNAYPPRRLVGLAQSFGSRSLVRSVCASSYEPFMTDLADRIHAIPGI